MPLPNALAGDSWTKKSARIIFPWLIYADERGIEVTYGELDKEIVARKLGEHVDARAYSHPLGTVGDALNEIASALGLDTLPPTNALVVNEATRIPGDGVDSYVEAFYDGRLDWNALNEAEKLELTTNLHHEIFSYPDWSEVINFLSDVLRDYPELSPFDGPFLSLEQEKRNNNNGIILPHFKPEKPSGGSGEGDDHFQLKHYVRKHPNVIGLSNSARGEVEHEFGSGDTVDIEFIDGDVILEVEIKGKNASDLEILRGVWQCIKYLHLAKTQQFLDRINSDARTIRQVRVLLVVGRKMPRIARRHAELLKIPYKEVVGP